MTYTYRRKGNRPLNIGSYMIGSDGVGTDRRVDILDAEVGISIDRYSEDEKLDEDGDKSILAYVTLQKNGTVKIVDMSGKDITLGKTFIAVAGNVKTKIF